MDNNRIPIYTSIFLYFAISCHNTNKKSKKFYYFCSLVVLTSTHVEFGFVLFSEKLLDIRVTYIAGLIVYIALKVSHIFMYWQTVIHRRKEINIFRELTNIDDIYVSKLYHWIDFKKSRRVVISNTLPGLIVSGGFSIVAFVFSFFVGTTISWMSITSTLVVHIRYVQYIYMISLVAEKLKILKSLVLINLKRMPKLDQLYALKSVYRKITNVQLLIDDLFGWSILFMVITSLSQVVWILNWLVLSLQGSENLDVIFKSSFVIFPEIYLLGSTCKACQNCENMGKEISTYVARSYNRHCNTSHCIEDFSLQMMHDPIQFTANRFFNLNLKNFTGMIVAVITQLFVLLQFSGGF